MPPFQTFESICGFLVDACCALGVPATGPEDDFFDIGGSSLLAVRLIARIEEVFGEDVLPPADVFLQRRLDALAGRLHVAVGQPGPGAL